LQFEPLEIDTVTKRGGYGSRELVGARPEVGDLGQVANPIRNCPREEVVLEVDPLEIKVRVEFLWDCASDLIVVHVNMHELGQFADFLGDGT